MTVQSPKPLIPDHLEDIATLSAAVGWPHRRDDISMLMSLGQGRVILGPEGSVEGVGMWWAIGEDLARLGMIIIDPKLQGRGLGKLLVSALLDDLAPRTPMLLATEAGAPLYRKLGFVEVGASAQHQGQYQGSPPHDGRLRAATAEDMETIRRLDAEAVGADRHVILSALWDSGRAAVLEENGVVTGYAFERSFGRGSVVGPIVAATEEDASDLFQAVAQHGFVRVDCFVEHATFNSRLAELGLAPLPGASPIMVRGTLPNTRGTTRVFGLSSHALG